MPTPAFASNPRCHSGSFSEVVLPSLSPRPTPPPFPANRRANNFRRIRKRLFCDVDYNKSLPAARGPNDAWPAKRDDGTQLPPFAFSRLEPFARIPGALYVRERRTQWSKDHYGVLCYRTSYGSTLKPVLPPSGRALKPHFKEIATDGCYLPQSIEVLAICASPLKVQRSQWSPTPNGHHRTRSMWHEALPPPGHPVFAGCTLHPLGLPRANTAPPTTIAALYPPAPLRRLVDRAVTDPIFLHERYTHGRGCEAYYRSTWGSILKPVSSLSQKAELTPHYEEVSTIGCYAPLSIEVLAICLQPGKVLRRVLTATGQHPRRSMWTWYPNQRNAAVFAPCTVHTLGPPNAATSLPTTLAEILPPPLPVQPMSLITAASEKPTHSPARLQKHYADVVSFADLGSRLKTVALSDKGLEPLNDALDKMVPLSHARLADVDLSISAAERTAAEATAAAVLAPPSWPTSPLGHSLELEDDIDDLEPWAPRSWTGAVASAAEQGDESAEGSGEVEEGVAGSLDAVDVSEHAAGQEEEAGGGQGLVEEEEDVVGSVREGEEREREEECEQLVEEGYEQLGEEGYEQPWEGDEQPWEEIEQQEQQSPQQQQQSQAATVGGNKRARDDEETSTSQQLGSPSKRQCSPEQSSAAQSACVPASASASTSAAVAAAALDDDDDDDDDEEPFFYDLRCYHGEVTASSLIRDSLVMEEGSRSNPVIVAEFEPNGDEG